MRFGKASGVTSPSKAKQPISNSASVITSPRNGAGIGGGTPPRDLDLEPDLVMMKLMSIIDAEIAALGAPASEMPRAALKAMTAKATASISRSGQALYSAEEDARVVYLASHNEANTTEDAVRQEIERIESELVTAKVALMETQAEKSRAQMQLIASQKALSQPGIKADLRSAEAEIRLKTAEQKNEATNIIRRSLEKRVKEKSKEVDHEKSQIAKLKKAIKDMEGDWGV